MLAVLAILSLALVLTRGDQLFEANTRTPVVVTTWKFVNATQTAWHRLIDQRATALDAVEAGCAVCEREQCDFTVGFGGSPDETGETTLDAMIMDGTTMNVGAVGGLRQIKNAVGVARRVLHNTEHTLLVGSSATDFALQMGFTLDNLTTPYSRALYHTWKNDHCQPNFRRHVTPDPTKHCGPYNPASSSPPADRTRFHFGDTNHDTIGMLAVDAHLRTASATSTNGARHKVPGRVGDSPIPGAGSYASDEIGAAAATGDGDVMMRFLPAFVAVEEMMRGRSPEKAAQMAVNRIAARYPKFRGGVIAVRKDGEFGAGCHGMAALPYCVANPVFGGVKVFYKPCN